jgi:hypothetical protein
VLPNGEADAGDGDALAVPELLVTAGDAKLASGGSRRHALDRANVVDEAGEHYAGVRAYTVIRSSPKVARSITSSRRAEGGV